MLIETATTRAIEPPRGFGDGPAPVPPPDMEWLQQLRQSVQKRADEYDQERSLKEKLFPFRAGGQLRWFDILYAEALWASIILAAGFVVFSVATAGLSAAAGFVLSVVLYMLPVLFAWALVGAYYLRRQQQLPRH